MPDSFDVAIIGFGPVGATLACLLGQLGVRVVALERERSVYHSPRAASFDAEAMRILQTAGVADALAPTMSAATGMRFVNAEGKLLLHWRRSGISPEGWASAYRFHQPTLETLLRDAVWRLPNVRVRLGVEVEAVEPARDAARVATRDLDTGARTTLTARWVIGCDGARSIVRQTIGGGLRELGPRERWMVLDVIMNDAQDVAASVGDSVQHCDPARPATYVPMAGPRRRWEFMLMPGDDPDEIATPARIWRLLRPWMIDADSATIERAVVYNFHALIAPCWRSGRLLLAGDAAHQMPPFLGQGLCAGLRDAVNLAWKLAGVIQERYPESLLDTYQSERAPHVEAIIALAVRIGGIIQATDPAMAAERDRTMALAPETMRVSMPPLGPGLHGTASVPAGTRAAQPTLGDGARLDDRVGYRFAVVALPSLLAAMDTETLADWTRAGVVVVPADGEAPVWLAELGCAAAIVRPDRAILAVAMTAQGLAEACRSIPRVPQTQEA